MKDPAQLIRLKVRNGISAGCFASCLPAMIMHRDYRAARSQRRAQEDKPRYHHSPNPFQPFQHRKGNRAKSSILQRDIRAF